MRVGFRLRERHTYTYRHLFTFTWKSPPWSCNIICSLRSVLGDYIDMYSYILLFFKGSDTHAVSYVFKDVWVCHQIGKTHMAVSPLFPYEKMFWTDPSHFPYDRIGLQASVAILAQVDGILTPCWGWGQVLEAWAKIRCHHYHSSWVCAGRRALALLS